VETFFFPEGFLLSRFILSCWLGFDRQHFDEAGFPGCFFVWGLISCGEAVLSLRIFDWSAAQRLRFLTAIFYFFSNALAVGSQDRAVGINLN